MKIELSYWSSADPQKDTYELKISGDKEVKAEFGTQISNSQLAAIFRRLASDLDAEAEEPTEFMCDGARGFLLGLEIGIKTYEDMKINLVRIGYKIPEWMKDKGGNLTKWDKADCIWRLMNEARLKEILK